MEDRMVSPQELAVREKRELTTKSEKTVPGRFYVPYAGIYETDEALMVVMEMPGVNREASRWKITSCAWRGESNSLTMKG
jgi:HSP20 family molecular chaperone IbpA